MANTINWFEIPVADMDRAQRFYEVMLARALRREQFGDQNLAVFPYEEPAAGRLGARQCGIVVQKTALPPGMGFFAHVRDTEGNVVGLHALK